MVGFVCFVLNLYFDVFGDGFECKTFACLFVEGQFNQADFFSSNELGSLALTPVNLECAPQWDCYSSLYLYYFSLLL